jgi:hypothetical protein
MNHQDAYHVEQKSDTAHNKNVAWLINDWSTSVSHKTNSQRYSPSMFMNLSMACRKMLKPRAMRKEPLKKAPRTFALSQPKVKLAGASLRSDS